MLLVTITSFLYMMTTVCKEVIDLSLPHAQTVIHVENWDKRREAPEIYERIAQYAKKNKVAIHKIVFRTNTKAQGEEGKYIFTFSDKPMADYQQLAQGFQIDTYLNDYTALTNENLVGLYVLTEKAPADLTMYLESLGLTVQVERNTPWLFVSSGLFLKVGNLFVVLLISTIFACFFYQISQRKKYGIAEMFGRKRFDFAYRNLWIDSLLILLPIVIFYLRYPLLGSLYVQVMFVAFLLIWFVTLFSVWLVQRIGTVSDKVKGSKPYRLLLVANGGVKLITLVCIVIFSASSFAEIQAARKTYQGLIHWQQTSDYYQLAFTHSSKLIADFSLEKEKETIKQEE